MPKRKRQAKRQRKTLLRKLVKAKTKDPTVTYVSKEPGSDAAWVIKVKGEQRDPADIDKKALAYGLLEAAVELQLREAEQELANLVGDHTSKATAKRKELKTKIEHLHQYRNRLYGLDQWPPTESHTDSQTKP